MSTSLMQPCCYQVAELTLLNFVNHSFSWMECYYGKTEDTLLVIGNFHNEEMGVILELNGKEVPFNIGNYMKPFKLVVQKDDN